MSTGPGTGRQLVARRAHGARALGWLGVGLLVSTVVVAAAARGLDGPVVLAGVVPRRWHVVGVLLAAALVALAAAALARLSAEPGVRPSRARRWASGVGVAVLSCAAVGSFGVVGLTDAITTYHVLSPASPGGCRIVVGERALLLLGSGTVYVLPPGERFPRGVAEYGADDGYRPITFGTYRLSWRGEVATLELSGTAHQPVDYDARPLACT